MKKYKLKQLSVEVTRRCNKKCPHCARGNAQNLTMSKEIIDRIINNAEDVEHILIGSGETLLEIERVQYLIDRIIKSHWSPKLLELTTNGTICDKRIIDVFEKFCLSGHKNVALLRISNDQFHDVEEYEQAYAYYKPLADAANDRLRKYSHGGGVFVEYTHKDTKALNSLWYEGKAVEYLDSGKGNGQFRHGKNVSYPCLYQHRIKIIGDTIPCSLQILANGNVCFFEELSYDNADNLSFGNIGTDSLSAIVDRHNDECLLLCSEIEVLRQAKYCRYFAEMSGVSNLVKLYGIICDRTLKLRNKARKLYPNVPAQTIIKELQFPKLHEMIDVMLRLYMKCPEYTPEMIDNIKKYEHTPKHNIYLSAASGVVIRNLAKSVLVDEEETYRLNSIKWILEASNGSSRRKNDNSLNFSCDDPAFGYIDYSEDKALEVPTIDLDAVVKERIHESKKA